MIEGAWAKLWSAKALGGGCLAVGLAWLAQHALLAGSVRSATGLYGAAAVVLMVALSRRSGHLAVQEPAGETDASESQLRAGWLKRAGGLALTAALAVVLTLLLRSDIGHPLGGWLWVSTLLALAITFRGTPRPSRPSLLPRPDCDFFGPDVPRLRPRTEAILTAGLLVTALVLRSIQLGSHPGIFGDEGEQGLEARAINEGHRATLFGYGWWGVPNLYFHCLAWTLRLFGDDVAGARMLSVLSGTLAVFFVCRIGRLLWGPRAGLMAGWLLALSPLALQFSRLAGSSAPTGMLWAGGFLFLLRALRARGWNDWVTAGVLFGLSLYFYPSGKLSIPLLGLLGLYSVLRWPGRIVRFLLPGWMLLGLAFFLTFLPHGIFCVQDGWKGFFGRARETSIFVPAHQALVFQTHGVAYDAAWAGQPPLRSVLGHPVAWTRVIAGRLWLTLEVLYRRGDPTAFYQIRLHGGTMLAPLLAALCLLGLIYGASRPWEPRFGLTILWFLGGLLGPALTMDTPSVQRLTGAWPALMLFPAVLVDRIAGGARRFDSRLALLWMTLPVPVLLLALGVQGYREYFVHYASLCPYCDATVQASFARSLGRRYKAYQLGIGEFDIYFGYGSTRFAAKDVEGIDVVAPAWILPITEAGEKGAAFLVYPHNAHYLPLIQSFHPGGVTQAQTGRDGSTRFTSYSLTPAQLERGRGLVGVYRDAGRRQVTRREPNLGTRVSVGQNRWSPPEGLAYPATASWHGGLVAPSFGPYRFRVFGDAQFEIDERTVIPHPKSDLSRKQDPGTVELVLAEGIHSVRLTGTLPHADAELALEWAPGPAAFHAVDPSRLFPGPAGGLAGEIWAEGGRAPRLRRSDPFFGFREAGSILGGRPFVARWRGKLQASSAGEYRFDLISNGPAQLFLDGREVQRAPGGPLQPLPLASGSHDVELRHGWREGRAQLEWFWTPPGGSRAIVPPTVLRPAARSWRIGEIPLPDGLASSPRAVASSERLRTESVLAASVGLKQPRGVAVDANGRVFIGDTGNHRVVSLDPRGRLIAAWGEPTAISSAGRFALLSDLAVTPGGAVATLDAGTGDIQLFDADGGVRLHLRGLTTSASGIAAAPDGSLWVADTGGSRLLRLGQLGELLAVLTGAGGPVPALAQPIDVAVADAGTVYAVDLRSRVVRLDGEGRAAQEWPVEIALGRGGSHLATWKDRLVLTDPGRHRLVVLDPKRGQVRYFGQLGSGTGEMRVPVGIASGLGDHLYVVDSDNARVLVVSDLHP